MTRPAGSCFSTPAPLCASLLALACGSWLSAQGGVYSRGAPAYSVLDAAGAQRAVAGDNYVLAIRDGDGVLFSWATSAPGALASPPPIATHQVTRPTAPGTMFADIAGRWTHAAAILSDGTIETFPPSVVPALPAGETYTQVETGTIAGAGAALTAAIRSDDVLVIWDTNGTQNTTLPILTNPLQSITFGVGFAVGLRTDGTLVYEGPTNAVSNNMPTSGTFVAVAAGRQHCLALRPNGTVVAWGFPNSPQLAIPTLPSGMTYTAIAAADDSSFALRSDGYVASAGDNSEGQRDIPLAPSGSEYVSLSAGYHTTVLLRSDGRVVAVGDIPDTLSTHPTVQQGQTPQIPPLGAVRSLAANLGTVALRDDGTAVSWGAGAPLQSPYGETFADIALVDYFDGTTTVPLYVGVREDTSVAVMDATGSAPSSMPPNLAQELSLSGGLGFVGVDGYGSALALRSVVGSVLIWNGAADVVNTRTGQTASVVEVEAGAAGVLALLADGTLAEWDLAGNVGTPPVLNAPYTKIAAGNSHSLALGANGQIDAWGSNGQMELNVPNAGTATYVAVGAGGAHSLAIDSNGELVRWGWDGGPIYPGLGSPPVSSLPFVEIDCGSRHCVARRSDGAVFAWGDTQLTAVPDVLDVNNVKVVNGLFESAALRPDGRIVTWPKMNRTGASVPSNLNVDLIDAIDVAAGEDYFLAVQSNGQIAAWGSIANVGNRMNAPSLPTGVTYTKVDATFHRSGALRSDGVLRIWGNGPLNWATWVDLEAMQPSLPAGVTWVDFWLGENHAVGLRSDGQFEIWGDTPGVGQAAQPNETADRFVIKMQAGQNHTVALFSDGQVEAWGWNLDGQATVPAVVQGVTVDIAAGANTSVARLVDGSLVQWGFDGTVVGMPWTTFPPPAAGMTYNSIEAGDQRLSARMGPAARVDVIGSGCPGSAPVISALVPQGTPRIGESYRFHIRDVPEAGAFVLVAQTELASPVDLSAFGMPGCFQYLPFGSSFFVGVQPGTSHCLVTLPVPYDPGFVGLKLRYQALLPDSNAGNQAGMVVSDAIRTEIGQ